MSPAFIKGVNEHLPEARVTFDKFHVVAHASKALDAVRRQQQKLDPRLKGMRWTLLKDANKLNLAQLTDLEALVRQSPPSVLPEPGFTVSNCATFSSANKSMSCRRCCASGAPTSCARRSNR